MHLPTRAHVFETVSSSWARHIRNLTLPVFAAASLTLPSLAQLPTSCKLPAPLAAAIRGTPSAKVYDAAGAFFAQSNDLRCALAAFEKAVQMEPASAEAQYNLGLAEAGRKHTAEAEQHLRLALKADASLSAARTALGTLLLDAGRSAEAETEFRTVLAGAPTSLPALDNVGLALAAQGRFAAAIRVWRQALAQQPNSPEIVLSVAAATFKNGDPEAAMAMLKKLVAQYPADKDAHFTLANIMAHTLLYTEAAQEYAAVVRLDPNDDAALLAYAKALSNSGSFEPSRPLAEQYVRRHPDDPEGHLVLGSIERKLTDYKSAEGELSFAVTARPRHANSHYELGMALLRDDQPAKAVTHLETALTLDPSDASTAVALASALRRTGDTVRAKAVTDRMLENKERERQATSQSVQGSQANAFLQQGEPAKAVELYRQMLQVDPNNARTAYNLALALAATHDLKGERDALETAARLDPKLAVAESELGMLDLAAGDAAGAEQKLRAALAMDPQFAPARGNLGLVLVLKGDMAAAETTFRQSIEDDPNYVQGYLNLGLVLASRQDFPGADNELTRALTLAPDDVKVLSAAAKVKVRLGKSDEALPLFRKNAALAPKSPDVHVELAIALADAYDLQAALREAKTAVALAPRSVSAQFNLGRILFDLGRLQEARASLQAACDLAPGLPDPRFYLALLSKQQGDLPAAASLLQTVVQAQPSNVMALYFLGQSLEPTDKPSAIAAWQRAVAINPGYTPGLWSLTRALAASDPQASKQYAGQLKAALASAHDLDAAELTANEAISSMQAHDWPGALKGMKEAIRICGDCAAKASLHKSLGLAFCHAGDLDQGEKELRYAESLKSADPAPDPDIQRALALIALARSSHA